MYIFSKDTTSGIISVFLFLLFPIMTSCQPEFTYDRIAVGDRYSLSVPSFLEVTYDINPDASLQYQNIWKDFFVMVIDESKANLNNQSSELAISSFTEYFNFHYGAIENALAVLEKPVFRDTTINAMPSKTVKLTGRVDGVEIFYYMVFAEGENRYYQVVAFSGASKKGEYEDIMGQIIFSLQEKENK
jgi:hypothetical protein